MDAHRTGCFIAEKRKEKNMSQKELAKHLHITDKAISKWERGLSFPDIPILIPLLASSIRRATELADAMECRCYHGGSGRTRLKVMKSSVKDYLCLVFIMVLIAGVVLFNIYF